MATYSQAVKNRKPVSSIQNILYSQLNMDGSCSLYFLVYKLYFARIQSMALNTINPGILQQKLTQQTVFTIICQWITSLLTDKQQQVQLLSICSSTRTISAITPLGCVISQLLFSHKSLNLGGPICKISKSCR